jgi:hypothetical protein
VARDRSSEPRRVQVDCSSDAEVAAVLTRAEARALSRSTPLSPSEFKAHRKLAERHVDPLKVVLNGAADAARRIRHGGG